MNTFTIILLVILFCVAQMLIVVKTKKKIFKFLPISVTGIGVLIGIIIHLVSQMLYNFEFISHSVMSENQYFAIFLLVPMIACFIGCLVGLAIISLKNKKNLIFFVPFIFFVLVYLIMAFTGYGLISIEQALWLIAFVISGILLCKGIFWGGIFGMIPAFCFIFMSTQENGQVINIEMPLGIIIVVYYIACGIVVFKKNNNVIHGNEE